MVVALLGLAACESARTIYSLPYLFPPPAATSTTAGKPTAQIGTVLDRRDDHTLDMFLQAYPADFLRQALASELAAHSGFARVDEQATPATPSDYRIDAVLREVSWATPDRDGISRTAYGVTLATGLVGGLIYGAMDTPAYSRVTVDVTVTRIGSNTVVLDKSFTHLHPDRIARLKVDDLQPRARILATAIKETLVQIADAIDLAVARAERAR